MMTVFTGMWVRLGALAERWGRCAPDRGVAIDYASTSHAKASPRRDASGNAPTPRGVLACLQMVIVGIMVLAFAMPRAAWADLSPAEYASPSGEMTLRVDPTQRSGAGPARYVLSKAGKVVWRGERPYTLWRAVVADDGSVGGYAYSEGYETYGKHGDLVIAIVAPDGTLRREERTARRLGGLHEADQPNARGMFLDAHGDRLVVRVYDHRIAGGEAWWTYRMRDGALLHKRAPRESQPQADALQWIKDAYPLAGTPLTLVQWWLDPDTASSAELCRGDESDRTPAGKERVAFRFAVLDAEWKPVWHRDFAAIVAEHERSRTADAILDTSTQGRFTVRDIDARRRIGYAVTLSDDTSGWSVREVANEAFAGVASSLPSSSAITAVNLRARGAIDLGVERVRDASEVRDVMAFAIGEAGRFALIRHCSCERNERTLVIVDGQGTLVHRVDLSAVRDSEMQVAWAGGDRWLLVVSGDDASRAWWIDAARGGMTPIDSFSAPSIKALAVMRDGGFIVLATTRANYTMRDALIAFTREGRPRWRIEEDSRDEAALFSPQDIAVTTTGDVVVLDGIRNVLQVYAADGWHVRNLDIEASWGYKPNYVAGLGADVGGGVVVQDSRGRAPIVRMGSAGRVSSSLVPTFADGRRIRPSRAPQVSPEGKVWITDGEALLGLDVGGRVDAIVGRSPDGDVLSDVAALHVARDGGMHVVDTRTGTVHVFDAQGGRKRVLRPAVDDYDGKLTSASLAVMDNGEVFVSREDASGFVHYYANGKRAGIASLGLDDISETWLAQPGGFRWVLGYRNVYRVDASGKAISTLDRMAGEDWLRNPGPASVSRDGAIAIVSGDPGIGSGQPTPTMVALFKADGTPKATWEAPAGFVRMDDGMAFDGDKVALLVGAGLWQPATAVVVTGKDGVPAFRFDLPRERKATKVFFVDGDEGQELWFFDGTSTITRYAMPGN